MACPIPYGGHNNSFLISTQFTAFSALHRRGLANFDADTIFPAVSVEVPCNDVDEEHTRVLCGRQ